MKKKVLNWATQFGTFCFLDNHQYHFKRQSWECMLLAGVKRKIELTAGNALSRLQDFLNHKRTWVAGHLGYDLKNETEQLHSAHKDNIGFADIFFFEPEYVMHLSPEYLTVEGENPERVFDRLIKEPGGLHIPSGRKKIDIKGRFTKSEYLRVVEQLKKHIVRGDCYEINFCQEFYAESTVIEPLEIFHLLCTVSPNPFSALYRVEDKWLICASPERFLKKEGNKITSQPIKGTHKREPHNLPQDISGREALKNSDKDKSENVMVVDLVRNDLARVCSKGSVKVDELFGIYSFPQVYQMISTISGELRPDITFKEIIRATFPMGSMTGAPKKKVMELIELYEKTKRGIFSGSVGYIDPAGNFDFNVVIRSIMYNAVSRYLSFQVGSGITWYSIAEKEWEECMLKAAAIHKVLHCE